MKTSILYVAAVLFLSTLDSAASNPVIAPPDNDLIENAIDLDSGPFPYSELTVNFPEATNTGDPTGDPSCDPIHPGVWYKFTANSVGTVAAVMVNPSVPYVIFFSAPDENVTDGTELSYLDVPGNSCALGSSKTIETVPGSTYYLYMKNQAISDVLINIAPAMVPANDLVENATNLNGLEDYSDPEIVFDLATFTDDGFQTGCDTGETVVVWYKFTAPMDGQVVAGIDAPWEDGGVIFYSAANENATSGADLTMVNQPTNTCEFINLQSIIATAGTTYYIFAALTIAAPERRATVSINLAGILGTAENTIEGFAFYPNPVTNELNLSATSTVEKVEIYNLMGQKVFSEKPQSVKTSIDLSH